MNIDYNAVAEILKNFLENEKTEILGISVGEEGQVRDAIKNILTAYEKEKEKNKELNNSYDKLAKECNEENRRCMLLAVENQDLKEKNKELNILRLQYLVSSFPDTTETYKKHKKELDKLLKEE